jgi:hypothetical protein
MLREMKILLAELLSSKTLLKTQCQMLPAMLSWAVSDSFALPF